MEVSEIIKEARINKGMTQQQVADAIFVTRQTISKWELGKSIPDEASLMMLYKCLDIDANQKKQLRSLTVNKKNILLVIFAILFSPGIIVFRYFLYKTGKLENKKFIAVLKAICFVLLSLYLRSLKDPVAYCFIGIIVMAYLIHQYYVSGLEKDMLQKQ